MGDYYQDSWDAFVAGVNIIAESGCKREICAEHDIIYLPRPESVDVRERVLALEHGWHDCEDLESLGFFV
jgi:hypothetical protein